MPGIEHNNPTAIHLPADAFDKGIRPALVRKAGKRLLSSVYDRRGITVLSTIFAPGDLCMSDLDTIKTVISLEDLKNIMCRRRTGKKALTFFLKTWSLKNHASLERHTFFSTPAMKPTDIDRDN